MTRNRVRVIAEIGGSSTELQVDVDVFDLAHDENMIPTRLSFSGLVVATPSVTQRRAGENRVATKVKVRRNDPGTSWQAAMSQGHGDSVRLRKAIYLILTHLGPLTDDELRAELTARGIQHSGTGVTKRRGELKEAGWVRSTDARRSSQYGANMIVWEAVPEGGGS